MPNCEHIQPLLVDYIDDCLPSSGKVAVIAHLNECESCKSELTQLQSAIQLLKIHPEPRADFWRELDTKLDAALERNPKSTHWIEKIFHWLQPVEHWAPVAAGFVLLIAGVVVVTLPASHEFDIVAQQRAILHANDAQQLLIAYKNTTQHDNKSNGSIHSFAPTVNSADYFTAGKRYAESISAILVNRGSSEILDKFNLLENALGYSGDRLNQLKLANDNIESALLSGDTDAALKFASSIKPLILENSNSDYEKIVFDIGAWSVGFRYQLIAKSIQYDNEAIALNKFIHRLKGKSALETLIKEFNVINSKITSRNISDSDFATLEKSIKNIDHLLQPI